MPDGSVATSVLYNMESFWDSCVQYYIETVGSSVHIKSVPTPFLNEDSGQGPSGVPCATGPITECPWSARTFALVVHKDLYELNRKTKFKLTGKDLERGNGGLLWGRPC